MVKNFNITPNNIKYSWFSDFVDLCGKEIDIKKYRLFRDIEKPKCFKDEIKLMIEDEIDWYISNFKYAFLENKTHVSEFFNIMLDIGFNEIEEFKIGINNDIESLNKMKTLLISEPPSYNE